MRYNLINDLVNGWRQAENEYLETGDFSAKDTIFLVQKETYLTTEETKEVEAQCYNLGI